MPAARSAGHAATVPHDDPFSTPGGKAFVAALDDMVLPDATRERLERVIADAHEGSGTAPAAVAGDD